MPDRIDRRINGNGMLFTVVLIIFAIATAAGIYVWRISRAPAVPLQDQTRSSAVSPRSDDPLSVTAFVPDQAGTAYVDLAPAAPGGIRASARDEMLAVYAVVNMLTQNLEEVRRVRFLIDGREDRKSVV